MIAKRLDRAVDRPSRERGSHSQIIGIIVGTNSFETTGSRVRRVSGSSTRDGSRLSPGVRADQQVDPLLSSPHSSLAVLLPCSRRFAGVRCLLNEASKTWIASNLPRYDGAESMSIATQLDHVPPDGPSRTLRLLLFFLLAIFCLPRTIDRD